MRAEKSSSRGAKIERDFSKTRREPPNYYASNFTFGSESVWHDLGDGGIRFERIEIPALREKVREKLASSGSREPQSTKFKSKLPEPRHATLACVRARES